LNNDAIRLYQGEGEVNVDVFRRKDLFDAVLGLFNLD